MPLKATRKGPSRLVVMYTCQNQSIFGSSRHGSKHISRLRHESMLANRSLRESVTVSFLSNLECSGCAKEYSYEQVHTFCLDCQSPLVAKYNLGAVRKDVDRDLVSQRPKGMWRWHELLPVLNEENQISLGEGDTPLLRLPRVGSSLGLANLYVKDESSNPTGSFKARGLAAAISKAKELGVEKVIIPRSEERRVGK